MLKVQTLDIKIETIEKIVLENDQIA